MRTGERWRRACVGSLLSNGRVIIAYMPRRQLPGAIFSPNRDGLTINAAPADLSTAAPCLQIRDLAIALPQGAERALAVDGVTLSLHRGRTTCLVGESGSGKSMIAWSMLGLLPHGARRTRGSILFGGVDLALLPERRLRPYRGGRIAMISQEPASALNPTATIGAQIREAFAAHPERRPYDPDARARALLSEVGLGDGDRILRRYPHQLSGGQRQRAVIAMALALEPEVLIADEPTTALDVTTQAQVLALIRRLQKSHGLAVLFITHDFSIVEEMADEVIVLDRGTIVEAGAADQVLNAPLAPVTRALLEAAPGWGAGQPPFAGEEVLLQVGGLEKRYACPSGGAAIHAARSVTFALRRGETLGIVGESGSGKSTVGRCLARLIDPDGGAIRLGGVDIAPLGGRALKPWRGRVQMIFQDSRGALNPRMRVGDILAEGLVATGVRQREALDRARKLLEIVGLNPQSIDRHPHQFSGGQRQRIAIARALAVEPELLIADEPVSALDATVQAQILDLLDNLTQARALTMIFVTHDLRVAGRICDRIAVMKDGEIVEIGASEDVLNAPCHDYARALIAAAPGRRSDAPGRDAPADALPGDLVTVKRAQAV